MHATTLLQQVHDCVVHECTFFARCSGSGQVLSLPGIVAGINAATPDRSLFNGVTYHSPQALRDNYAAIASAYDSAGVRAWTVWTHVGDLETPAFLADRGHLFDGDPVAMAAEMHELVLPDYGDLVWERTEDTHLIGAINDSAFGFPPPAFEAAFDHFPDTNWRGYIARVDSKPVSTLLACHTADGDCGITSVATLPDFRKCGLASRLLSVALTVAQQCGMTSTTLQASPLGTHVYAALGYRDLGRMAMWELRK